MRELRLAVDPLLDPEPRSGAGERTALPLSRTAFAVSVLVHLVGLYAASRMSFVVDEPLPAPPRAEFVWITARVPPPSPLPVNVPPPAIETPRATAVEPPAEAETREQPVERPQPEERVVTEAEESEPAPSPLVEPRIDFEAERRRAAAEVVEERARTDSYLTFSIDEVAPPRPVEEPKPKYNIFNPGPGAARTSVGQVGQGRTRLGNKVRELCNALGGFGVGFQGFHLFDACGGPDDEPSGLFPEVRPAYLDLLPECAESEPENPELAAASPFSTVKCRLVRPVQVERWAYPGQPPPTP